MTTFLFILAVPLAAGILAVAVPALVQTLVGLPVKMRKRAAAKAKAEAERQARLAADRRWKVREAIARNDARYLAREQCPEPSFMAASGSGPGSEEPTWNVRREPQPGIFEQPKFTPDFSQPPRR